MARPRPKTQAAVMPRKDEDVLEYMKSMAEPKDKRHRAKPSTRSASRNVSTIAKRHRDLQAAFGFGCNVEEHIKFGKCLDGRCMQRLEWEVDKLSVGSHHFRDKDLSLHQACEFGNEFAVHHLVQLGPSFNAKNQHGQTALHVACRVGPVALVRHMLAANAVATPRSYRMDMNTQDNNGNTCLHIAAKANHLDITQCLLDAGCPWNITNNEGKIAADVCGRDQRIYHVLKQHAMAHDLGDEVLLAWISTDCISSIHPLLQ